METQDVTIFYLLSLASDRLLEQFVQQRSAAYKGRKELPELILTANGTDDMPFILLKRVGFWMHHRNTLSGTENVFTGVIRVQFDGAIHTVAISADEGQISLKLRGGSA